MGDQKGRERSGGVNKDAEVIKAINEIASKKSGQIFLRWLAKRCFSTRSTIVGDPVSNEINPLGSIMRAGVQRLYQEIHRNIKPNIRINIDYPDHNNE